MKRIDVPRAQRAAWLIGRLAVASAAAGLAACASAPPAAKPTAVAYEEKMAWLLRLEDQRILKLPEPPPPPPPPKGSRTAPPPPPATSGPDLARLATDADARIRRRAAIAIGRVGLSEGIPAVTPLLADADADVRQAAAFGLGLIGDRSASAALLPLLADPSPLVRGRAAEGLGLMGVEEAAAAIAKMTAEYARSPVVTAMSPDDEQAPGPPEAEAFKLGVFALVRLRAYAALASVVLDGSGTPVTTWWPVAYALQRINDARAAPALRQLAQVKGRYTPAFAARGLGEIKDAGAVDLLVTMVDPARQPREVVAAAIRALAQTGATARAKPLAQIASDPKMDPNLRLEAVSALAALKAVDQLPYVQDLITDEWPAMRAAALRGAAAIDPESFILILSGLETDRHWLGRAALADALGMLPPDIALARLTLMLKDEDQRVIPAVLRALARLRAPELEGVLRAHLQAADFVVRETAATLFGELKPAGGLAALREAYEAGRPDSAYGARAAAIEAIAAYGGPEAIAAIEPALADPDWAVRVRAADLLAKLDPSGDHARAIRPVPNTPAVPYDDPQLWRPPFSPHVFLETAKGTIEFELAVLDAPQTVRSFMQLVRKGFFNGLPVHRVVPNFVVQGGDPRSDGEGGPGYTIRAELNERPFLRGTVGMARAAALDTAGSQFFIMHSPAPHLDGRYTAFGHVVSGMDVVDRIQVGDVIERVRVWDGEGWE